MKKRDFMFILIVILIINSFPTFSKASVSINAKSAVLIEQESGRILYEKEAHKVSRIASITKIMTAILAIESGKMNEMVKVSERAAKAEGSSVYLKPGEKITLENLVYGLMLRSGNDAAVAIAEYVGGSVEGFVYLMNEKASQIGMTNTHFANPHGLDDYENHLSTAYDMAILTRYAMENDTYRKISGTKMHRAPNPNESWDRVWKNKNRLLTELYDYSTGGKTGYTKRAKRTLVSTARKGDLNLIAVTLNDPDDWNDHIALFETGFKEYDLTEIVSQGEVESHKLKEYKNKLYLKNSFDYPLTSKEEGLIKVEYKLIHPESLVITENQKSVVAGKVIVYLGERTIKTMPVYYEPKTPSEKKSFFKIFKGIFTSIIRIGSHG